MISEARTKGRSSLVLRLGQEKKAVGDKVGYEDGLWKKRGRAKRKGKEGI